MPKVKVGKKVVEFPYTKAGKAAAKKAKAGKGKMSGKSKRY